MCADVEVQLELSHRSVSSQARGLMCLLTCWNTWLNIVGNCWLWPALCGGPAGFLRARILLPYEAGERPPSKITFWQSW